MFKSDVHQTSTFLRAHEIDGVFFDAFLAKDTNELVFLSAWSKDTQMLDFIARLELGSSDDIGIGELNLYAPNKSDSPISIRVCVPGSLKEFQKRSARVETSLFGGMIHTFIFDKRVAEIDPSNRSLICLGDNEHEIDPWPIVKKCCHLPLLDHWRESVLEKFHEALLIKPLLNGFRVTGIELSLVEIEVEEIIETLVKKKVIEL